MKMVALSLAFAVTIVLNSTGQITSAPNFSNLRAMAEWEEVQALTISWTSFPAILKQIVAAARLET
ncbi:MAG: hypothetical protein ACKO7B_22050, partial [Flavobacteriales bacterium]